MADLLELLEALLDKMFHAVSTFLFFFFLGSSDLVEDKTIFGRSVRDSGMRYFFSPYI